MKRIVWIIIVVAVVGYFFNSYTVNKAKREAERAEAERIEQTTKTAVSQMASHTNAVSDWEENLSKGERFRFESILTVELERLWLQQRPILFVGAIKDIATHDQSRYVVLVERSLFGSFDYMFGTELQLSLLSDKDKVDSFLKEHPDLFKDYGFKNGVAVVARINSIRTTYVSGEEGEREEVKIGDGELLDLLYTGDVTF
ncbi:MAG: hypothetical protein COB30_011675 [Ectothiorhodospiraceae bacterium]|nr:hypothetical protein [Ectothiorhodospiraceae bacterium]